MSHFAPGSATDVIDATGVMARVAKIVRHYRNEGHEGQTSFVTRSDMMVLSLASPDGDGRLQVLESQ